MLKAALMTIHDSPTDDNVNEILNKNRNNQIEISETKIKKIKRKEIFMLV